MDITPVVTPGHASRLARMGQALFGYRLWIGVLAAAASLELLEPGNLFGRHETAGRIGTALIALAGLALRMWGSGSAGNHTRTAHIEAPRLSTGGPYAFVRNPIYAGSMLLGFGTAGFIGDPLALWICAGVFAILYFTIIPAEEAFLLREFGEHYERYCASVPRLLPRWSRWEGATHRAFNWRAARGELGIAAVVVAIYAALLFEEYLDAHYGW